MVVSTEALTKRYGSFTALDACTFNVQRGEVFGLLGPNGAGKTTLLRLLLGFLNPSGGKAQIDGLDCHHQSVLVRDRVAYLPGEARLFRRMSGHEVLRFFTSLRPASQLKEAQTLADRLDLDLHRRVAFMSTGMRQKLALAATLCHNVNVYILDEPTANLDPNVRQVVMDLLREKQDSGHTILISSHVLSEMEESCDRVVILRSGQLVHTQVMSQLRQRHRVLAEAEADMPGIPDHLRDQVDVRTQEKQVTIDTVGDLSKLMGWLSTLPLKNVSIEPRGLRAVYDQFHSSEETV